MWFKKKANISGYNPNTAVDGTDWRTTGNGNRRSWSVSRILPSAADAGNYFYLPTLGYYSTIGQLYGLGSGLYWSSSGTPWTDNAAYYLIFDMSYVSVDANHRQHGFRVEPTFE